MTKAKKKRKRNGEKTFWRFENTDHFIHPSSKQLKKKKGTYGLPSQCPVKSDKNKLIKVTQWDFPDTSLFRANMLTCPQDQISIKMEQYSQSALSLLMPFRSQSDFVPIGYSGRKPYTNKLREVYNDDETKRQQDDMPTVFTDENIRFLQNLQDCAHNFTRHKVSNDDLQSVTEAYCPPDCVRVQEQDDDSDEEEGSDDIPFPSFFNQLDEDVTDEEFMFLEATMQGYSFDSIMLKRKKQWKMLTR
ncbi:hypothetical protein SEMRO_359_G126160.1 [Seminavis robusta]|uniref:Uncharacterized protein n=1 Tax=Seminavis robusta TaxID=568900 RepID=A0A9N8HDV7_9STRA|nr:hypothetical protein SEMRO_359_G126160.1 [Seminavis robusta]|eukprot:Sro359_g126160.1 n/a (246) ;mRNA; f:72819-73556